MELLLTQPGLKGLEPFLVGGNSGRRRLAPTSIRPAALRLVCQETSGTPPGPPKYVVFSVLLEPIHII